MRFIAVYALVEIFGSDRCKALFHAFTGCDTVSSFEGLGKKCMGNLELYFPDEPDAFCSCNQNLLMLNHGVQQKVSQTCKVSESRSMADGDVVDRFFADCDSADEDSDDTDVDIEEYFKEFFIFTKKDQDGDEQVRAFLCHVSTVCLHT